MTWVYLDDKWDTNAKIAPLSDLAKIVWVRGLTYCRHNVTKGFIPEDATEGFLKRCNFKHLAGCIEELCTNHLPEEDRRPLWGRVRGGYQMNDYEEWNDVQEELERHKKTTRERVARFRAKHKREAEKRDCNADGNATGNAQCNVTANATETLPVTPVTPLPARAIPLPLPLPDPGSDHLPAGPAAQASERKKQPNPETAGWNAVKAEYERCYLDRRGVPAPFGGRDGKAINDLLGKLGKDHGRACRIVRAAFSDQFWSDKTSLAQIAADPARFEGNGRGTRQQPLVQPVAGGTKPLMEFGDKS